MTSNLTRVQGRLKLFSPGTFHGCGRNRIVKGNLRPNWYDQVHLRLDPLPGTPSSASGPKGAEKAGNGPLKLWGSIRSIMSRAAISDRTRRGSAQRRFFEPLLALAFLFTAGAAQDAAAQLD